MRKTFTAAIAFWLTRPSMIASAAATSASMRFCKVIGKASRSSFRLNS